MKTSNYQLAKNELIQVLEKEDFECIGNKFRTRLLIVDELIEKYDLTLAKGIRLDNFSRELINQSLK